jgi:hypothetical protein
MIWYINAEKVPVCDTCFKRIPDHPRKEAPLHFCDSRCDVNYVPTKPAEAT